MKLIPYINVIVVDKCYRVDNDDLYGATDVKHDAFK
jgi:hypothetical protein